MPGTSETVYSIHAVVKNKKTDKWEQAGRFDVLTRTPKTYSVTLVPMGVAVTKDDGDAIEAALDGIWKHYGITWTVDVDDKFYIDEPGDEGEKRETLINGIVGAGLISGDKWPSEYSPQQKAINIAYRDYVLATNYNKETMYVFLLPSSKAPGSEQVGDMPLGKQWGYLYSDAVDTRTLAHELGHGKTILDHTFKSEAEKGTTSNLMDYPSSAFPNGTDLVRQQWAAIHDPAVFDPVQSDEDAALYVIKDADELNKVLNSII
jgi:hypothetical protein